VDSGGKDTTRETSREGEENANVSHDSEACVLTVPWPSAGGLSSVGKG
jgi:hypothetical protein